MRPNKIKQMWKAKKCVTLGWLSVAHGITAEVVPNGLWPLDFGGALGEPVTRGIAAKLPWLNGADNPAASALRAAGHEVDWVRTAAPGIADQDVLAWASREDRILITFDKDFGELARGSALPTTCGVILLRMPMTTAGDAGRRMANQIAARDDWAGHFSVIEPGRVRMRPLAK